LEYGVAGLLVMPNTLGAPQPSSNGEGGAVSGTNQVHLSEAVWLLVFLLLWPLLAWIAALVGGLLGFYSGTAVAVTLGAGLATTLSWFVSRFALRHGASRLTWAVVAVGSLPATVFVAAIALGDFGWYRFRFLDTYLLFVGLALSVAGPAVVAFLQGRAVAVQPAAPSVDAVEQVGT